MPNTSSSKKRNRQAVARNERNRTQRSALRTAIKKVRTASTREDAETALRSAESLIDRAARKHLLHANTAARTKARLHKAIRQAESA